MTSKRKTDAIPGGGGGPSGAHRLFSEKQAQRQADARRQTPSLSGGLTHGLTIGAYQHEGEPVPPSGSGTSIFDPVLCELVYRWFCPPGGTILDPFAGGSVRGIVASKLGRAYLGIDLSATQIAANEAQAKVICGEPMPRWVFGDSRTTSVTGEFDLIFTCPPYANLERYSDDPLDLSTMDYPDFVAAYADIIERAAKSLRQDRFACVVIGEARGPNGFYYGLVPDTVKACEAAGLRLYNEAILVTAAGSLPIRTRKQFESSRKFGKTHQNLLVLCKGDPIKATKAVGDVEFGSVDGIDAATPAQDGNDMASGFGRVL